MEQIELQWEPERRLFKVGELNALIRGMLVGAFNDIWVAGEISGCRQASSGHYYFTLKDEDSQLKCACFRNTARFLKFKPQDGVAVLARGRIDVYEMRGEYQLLVEGLEPRGHGALQLAFDQLKKKLSAEGLFDAARKRPLPKFPRRIGVVTSPSGAVIRDILHVLERRFPGLHLQLYPALVQGAGSIDQVCRGLEYFSESGWAEVVIVARGGGSLEDLWTFNEEAVARAIAGSRVPVISAVGHETDFTIADFVADLRAPTPSAAAEVVVCTRQELLDRIAGAENSLGRVTRFRLAQAARQLHELGIERATSVLYRAIGRRMQRVDDVDYRLRDRFRVTFDAKRRRLAELDAIVRRHDVRLRFAQLRRRLERSGGALRQSIERRLSRAAGRLAPLAAHLSQLSPLRVLERGYAIVENEAGQIVKSSAQAPPGALVGVRLADGRLRARVTENR
ncbi:MAG: exodeoxyribonuclease VII large subunit [Bryobacteraceae bacterium]